MASLDLTPDPEIRCTDYPIGCIGAGFIMADVHLAAYRDAGFDVRAIASRTPAHAGAAAERWQIPTVYPTPEALLDDPEIAVVDIAYPPHLQGPLILEAARRSHIRGILAQKPLAPSLREAAALIEACEATGTRLSVNQNMRFDQSIRVLKQLLDQDALGTPVFASIVMHAVPHWQSYLDSYERLTLLNMSVHHLDCLRYLFGEVRTISTSSRPDPRRRGFVHDDGIAVSTLTFDSGVMAVSLDDIFAFPEAEAFPGDAHIHWRVEGEAGVAKGTIGWPDYPEGSPSTLTWCGPQSGHRWASPAWSTRWFPDAFKGVMEQLQYAIHTATEPELGGRDNLKTMALIEAAYRSLDERREIAVSEIPSG